MCRLALTGALLLLCTNTAAGCRQQEKQEVTPEVLMDAVDKNMKEVNSASSSLEIEVELEDVIPFVGETTPTTTDEAAAATAPAAPAANPALPVKK